MRILLLAQWYPPEPEPRIHVLAEELAVRGHQVTTITGFPNYPSGEIYPGFRVRWRQWEMQNGVRVLRLPLFVDHSKSKIKRLANYSSFALSATVLGAAMCGAADVMWVYHPPLTVGLPAWWIGLTRRIPFVFEIQDMWPETLAATGMFMSPRLAKWTGRAAKLVYDRSAAITVISPGFKESLIAKGVPPDKVHVIPNWADEEVFRPLPRDEMLGQQFGFSGRFNIVYGGNLGAAQALGNVLDAAQLLRDLPEVQFVFIGTGVEASHLQQQAEARELTNIRWIGYQPPERMPLFFALADAVLVHLKPDPLFEITIPGKLFAYLACGRPILCSVAGDTASIVNASGAGLTCPPGKPAALAQAVRRLFNMPTDQREAMGASGRGAFMARYTRGALVNRYEAILEEVVARKSQLRDKLGEAL